MRRSEAAYAGRMSRDLSVIGHALSAPTRSTIVGLLMDGSARPAGELAARAGVGASTASEHLAVLLDSGLLVCRPRGRARFYAIADADVAGALEQLGQLCPPTGGGRAVSPTAARGLEGARLCYDHLAGRLGIAVTDALVARGWVDADVSVLTPDGEAHLVEEGIDVAAMRRHRRPLVRACPDWTERRSHLAGAVGAAIATRFLDQGWVRRRRSGRGVEVSRRGREVLRERWGAEVG
jgi:DNA-binding transcriptional ArsR family regulator